MLTLIQGNGFELERNLRNDVQEKIEMALGRFERQIGRVHVYLADLNGPKKGVDKSIRLVIDIERQPVVVIDEQGEDWLSLLESVSDRASRTLSRHHGRSRSKRGRTSMAGDQESLLDSFAIEENKYSEEVWNPLRVRTERRK